MDESKRSQFKSPISEKSVYIPKLSVNQICIISIASVTWSQS